MFNKFIQQTPFSTNTANDVMSLINGHSPIRGDVSFISTLRALVFDRVSAAGEEIRLLPRAESFNKSDLDSCSVDDALACVLYDQIDRRCIIRLTTFNHYSDEANDAWFSAITEAFPKKYSGWICLEKIGYYFRKRFPISCFINPELHSVYLFTTKLTASNLHHIQCAIPAFLPWYFTPENPLTELERELVQSLNETNSEHYEAVLEKMAGAYDFRAARIRKVMSGFETKFEKALLESKYESLRTIEGSIEEYQRRIRDRLAEKTRLDLDILGLENKIATSGEGSEMMDYFLANPFLSIRESSNSAFNFVVKTELAYWKEDALIAMLENRNSLIYKPNYEDASDLIAPEDMDRLFRAIFVDRVLQLRVCAAYCMQFDASACNAVHGYGYGPSCNDAIPNTHIDQFSCMGDHSYIINDLLGERDYIGAVDQCVTSARSLNFEDPTVIREFVRGIYGLKTGINRHCIVLPDGSVVNPEQAIEWLKEQEES